MRARARAASYFAESYTYIDTYDQCLWGVSAVVCHTSHGFVAAFSTID